MDEMLSRKKDEARRGRRTKGMDIMGSLVDSAYREESEARNSSPGRPEKGKAGKSALSDSEILGNAFVMIIAGHETTANSIHFTLLELAMNSKAQKEVQKEVQSIYGNTPPETWDYESSINKLLGGFVGAALNEQLRLMPPIISIPKTVSKHQNQVITIDGKKFIIPGGINIWLCSIAAHRNPRYWPTKPSTITDRPDDLDDFKPERWFIKIPSESKEQLNSPFNSDGDGDDDDSFGGYTGKSSHSTLFRPVPGSYFPFSEGARSCLGRRLAQIEVMAVLAVIFQKYSIELAVDEWASDEEVMKMTVEEKRDIYKKAREKARATLRTATPIITLKLHSDFIPVRMVKKGEERFVNIID